MMQPKREVEMDLTQMRVALDAMAGGVTVEHLMAIGQFIEEIGGLENANDAVEMLLQMEAASGDFSDSDSGDRDVA